jgi:hypothetical protein
VQVEVAEEEAEVVEEEVATVGEAEAVTNAVKMAILPESAPIRHQCPVMKKDLEFVIIVI